MKHLEYFSGNRSVLCIIAETRGSCPGKTGFKMVVSPTGPSLGSIGGGALEHQVIQLCRKRMIDESTAAVLRSFDHRRDAEPGEKSGMICSGSQKLILIPHPPLNLPDGRTKAIRVTEKGLQFLSSPPEKEGFFHSGSNWVYWETVKRPPVVYIFGGGHCSKALTPILNSLDMRTVIVDDREHVWTMEENREAWQRIHMDYEQAGTLVPDNGEALVLIMTASHKGDSLILEKMLSKNLKYLGMMASRATSEHIFLEMREKGFPEKLIERVHTPVGIPISSHTPAEIAVSISAEIIQVLNSPPTGSPCTKPR